MCQSEDVGKSFRPLREVVGRLQEGLEEILNVVFTKEETKEEVEATQIIECNNYSLGPLCATYLHNIWVCTGG